VSASVAEPTRASRISAIASGAYDEDQTILPYRAQIE
jgi:hypothetical protein